MHETVFIDKSPREFFSVYLLSFILLLAPAVDASAIHEAE
jgi:hypothetical protein